MLEPLVSSSEYAQYISLQTRPASLEACHVAKVDVLGKVMNNATIYVCEVFCRFPSGNGKLCSHKKNYKNITRLKIHLRSFHNATITVVGTERRPQQGGRYPRLTYELSLEWLRTEILPGLANAPSPSPVREPKKLPRMRGVSNFEQSSLTKARSFESLDSEQKQLIQKNRYLIQFDANTYLTRSLETRWVFGAMSDRVDVAESKKLFNQHNDRPVLDGACEACSQKGIEVTDCIPNYPHCALTEYFGFPFAAEAAHNRYEDLWDVVVEMEYCAEMLDLGFPDDLDHDRDDE